MNFNDYQQMVEDTALYPEDQEVIYPALGLNGEAGEVADKIKKVIRDKGGEYSNEDRWEIVKELGDVLWYIVALGKDLGYDLDEIAEANYDKLRSRLDRGVVAGSGDNR